VNFEIKVSDIDELHSAVIAGGNECFRWRSGGIGAMIWKSVCASSRFRTPTAISFACRRASENRRFVSSKKC